MKSMLLAGSESQRMFDENCLDQSEHTRMLEKVSLLSNTFTSQLRKSFLFQLDQKSVQLNLVSIFLHRNALDFSRLLNDLRTYDLISDVTVLDLRRNGQKCLDAAYSLNGLLSNFSVKHVFLQNASASRSEGVPRSNENIISSLQTMLLAIDANLNKLSNDFSRLYADNELLLQEMRSLVPYQTSIEQRYR